MALMYVELEQAKEYSAIFHCAKDDTITLLIQAASAAVKNYLKDFSPYEGQRNFDDDYVVDSAYEPLIDEDSNEEQVVKPEVKLAVLLIVDKKLNPKKYGSPTASDGYLDDEVTALLYPLRDPEVK